MDELYQRDPEPCSTCRTGVMLFVCYDGVRRCRKCVHEYAEARGWNELVIPRRFAEGRVRADEHQRRAGF